MNLTQFQKLSPQQIQLIKLLEVPTISLEQRIKQEIEDNPALEEGLDEEEQEQVDEETKDETDEEFQSNVEEDEDGQKESESNDEDEFVYSDYIDDDEIPLYKMSANNTSPDEERKEFQDSSGITFHEQLLTQLGLVVMDDRKYLIASYIIGNLDDSGYLQRNIDPMVDDLAFSSNIVTTPEELNELLAVIQEFDPPGIGARNLRECLLIQLKRIEPATKNVKTAILIIENHFEEFTKKHYDNIYKRTGITKTRFKNAEKEILKLNPKPGNTYLEHSRPQQYIVPDFIISNNDGVLELILNSKNAPELRVSRTYQEMLGAYFNEKDKSRDHKDAMVFVRQKIDSAKWFIDAIKQRQKTLYQTMNAIIEYQKEYFMEGDESLLKPMILKDIADKINLDISTISRVTNSKYVQTPFGTFPLKSFFSDSMTNDSGEEVSTREIKRILQDFIGSEDKKNPLNDEKLVQLLKEKGFNIARRTIAKYRENLNISAARMRKKI